MINSKKVILKNNCAHIQKEKIIMENKNTETPFLITLLLGDKRISSIETTEDSKEQVLEIIYQLAVDLSEHTGKQYTVIKESTLDINSEYNTKNLNTLLNLEYGDDYTEQYTIHFNNRQKYNEIFSGFAEYHGLTVTEQLPIGYVFNRWKFAKNGEPNKFITVTLEDLSLHKKGQDIIFFTEIENKSFTTDAEDFPSMLVKIKDILLDTKKADTKKKHPFELLEETQSLTLL